MSSDNIYDCHKQLEKLQNDYHKLQQEHEAILNSTHDFIFFIDVDSNHTFRIFKANKKYLELMGLSQEEIRGKSIYELFDHDIADHFYNNYLKCCETKDVFSLEETLTFYSESQTFSTQLTPIIENGQVIQIVGFAQDITEQKSMKNRRIYRNKILTALANKEKLADVLKLTIDWLESEDPQAKGAIMLLDRDKQTLQLASAPNLPHEFKEEIHGLRVESNSACCGTAVKLGERVISGDILNDPKWSDFTEILEKYDLKSCWSEPVYSNQGEIIATFAVYFNENKTPTQKDFERLNISADSTRMTIEHKQTEEELRQSEEKFRTFIENASDIVFTLNEQGYFNFVSPNWQLLLGHDPNSVVGRHYGEFVHNEDIDRVTAKFKELLEVRNLESEIEYRVQHKNGEWNWHASRINILAQDKGQSLVIGIARDITERKEAERQIRYLSFHDSLTGLYNRAYLDEEIKEFDNKHFYPLSVIMIDLNGLKLVNDTHGHMAGDEMLKETANLIKKSVRSEDLVARWGGDEFLVLLPQTTNKDANKISEELLNNCDNKFVYDIPISIAVGTATKNSPEANDRHLTKTLIAAEDDMYKQKLSNSRSDRSSILYALLKTLEAKSYETENHTLRMREIAKQIGEKIGLSDSELNKLNLLITLHDIGKINIPEEILIKEGNLNNQEWEAIKSHPITGYRIALATEEFAHVADGILAHHERWDGKGYPQGLKGKEIPLLARIAAIADAYEVMSNGRPYQDSKTQEEIIAEFKRCSGTQFDPELVQAFLEDIN